MNEIIRISNRQIGSEFIQTVDARELHERLEVSTRFNDWFSLRVSDCGFTEGIDYVGFTIPSVKPIGGRPTKEYFITLDVAKHFCMLERNEKGKQVRQYFIDCEKALQPKFDLNNPEHLRGALLTYSEKAIALAAAVQKLEEAVEERDEQLQLAAPKIEFYNSVGETSRCFLVGVVAKTIGVGQNKFFEMLREQRILMRRSGGHVPYETHSRHFKVRYQPYIDSDGFPETRPTSYVTALGVQYLVQRFGKKEAA